jgi:FAD-linked sulfhydryl oxidase
MIIEEGAHNVSRQELGKMGWTMLHMMTGSFPEDIPPELVEKWNAFLLLFGHFYPCKICSAHFLQLLKDFGPFTGNKKQDLMVYLC